MSVPLVPINLRNSMEDWAYVLARTINELLKGRANNTGTVTLTAGTTTTTVTNNVFQSTSVPVLMPTTANAAGALATTYVSSRTTGSFVLTHANAGSTDRSFLYLFWG